MHRWDISIFHLQKCSNLDKSLSCLEVIIFPPDRMKSSGITCGNSK